MIDLDFLRKRYREQGIPTILDDGLKVLLETVQKYQPKNVLEIGTATGMSASAMLFTCKDARITTVEILESSYKEAEKNFKEFGLTDRVTQKLGDSLQVLKELDEQFDFVFLDGSKSKYKACLELIEPHLKNGAIVVADNVLFRGYVTEEVPCPRRYKTIKKYMREYLKYVFYGENYKSEIFKVGDGVSVSQYLKGE